MTPQPKVDIGEIVGALEPAGQQCGAHVQSLGEAAQISIAVSLKRIADTIADRDGYESLRDMIWRIAENGRPA